MIKNENGVWEVFRDQILPKHPSLHYCRVESHATSLGFPDVDLCFKGVDFKLELKHRSAKDPVFKLRPSQHRFMQDRIKAGGKVFVLAYDEEKSEWLLINGIHSKSLVEDGSYDNWCSKACISVRGAKISFVTIFDKVMTDER